MLKLLQNRCWCVFVFVRQACAPLWSQECGTSMFSTGICASVSDDLEPREPIAPTAQSKYTFVHTKTHRSKEFWCTDLRMNTEYFGRMLDIHGYRDCAGWLQQHLPLVRGPELPQQHPQQVPHQHRPDAGKTTNQYVFALPMSIIYISNGNFGVLDLML